LSRLAIKDKHNPLPRKKAGEKVARPAGRLTVEWVGGHGQRLKSLRLPHADSPIRGGAAREQGLHGAGSDQMDVFLTQDLKRFVGRMVKSGRYNSTGEVICVALWGLQEREQLRKIRVDNLRKMVAKGIESIRKGGGVPFDLEAFKAKARARYKKRMSKG
jgi:antitoxin ParD1/3/4